ncbi:TPR-like protein [Melanomma pulvis-pyrius CBS 109.77]|uniref:TPR-like protein n=1 Tax=Melanomma pulvis-pyrius CBS 109.77 TaxID=1314802 RepID=A0A6A6XBR7_9PLEO|nr:TPR-like protein [Melanomma pulvis-pyrius CBS 109.77]
MLLKDKTRFLELVRQLLLDIKSIKERKRVAIVAHNTAAWLAREAIIQWQYEPDMGHIPVGIVDHGLPRAPSEELWTLELWESFRKSLLVHFKKVSLPEQDEPRKDKLEQNDSGKEKSERDTFSEDNATPKVAMLDHSAIVRISREFEQFRERLAVVPNLEVLASVRKVSRSATEDSKKSNSSTGSNENTDIMFVSINEGEEQDIIEFLSRISAASPASVLTLLRSSSPPESPTMQQAEPRSQSLGRSISKYRSRLPYVSASTTRTTSPNASLDRTMSNSSAGTDDVNVHRRTYSPQPLTSAIQKPRVDRPQRNVTIQEPNQTVNPSNRKEVMGDPSTNRGKDLQINDDKELKQNKKLASSYFQKGDLAEAERIYHILIEWCYLVQRLDRGYDKMRLQMAQISYIRGNYKLSEVTFRELLGSQYSRGSENPKEVLLTSEITKWLALSEWRQGKYKNAEGTLDDCRKWLPEGSKNNPSLLSTLALVLASAGALKRAWKLSLKATRKQKSEIDADNSSSNSRDDDSSGQRSNCLVNHARVSCAVGRLDDADRANQEALEDMRTRLGPKHFVTLDAASLRAELLVANSESDQVGEEIRRTLRDVRDRLGEHHPSTLQAVETLVLFYRGEGRYSDAEETARYLVRRCEGNEDIGMSHPQTLRAKTILAEIFLASGKWEDAERYQREVVEIHPQEYLGDYPGTFFHRIALANILRERGKWDEARDLILRVLIEQLNKFGNEQDEEEDEQTLPPIEPPQHLKEEPLSEEEIDMTKLRRLLRSSKYVKNYLCRLPEAGLLDPLASGDPVRIYPSIVQTLHCLGLCEQFRDDANLVFTHGMFEMVHDIRTRRLGATHRLTVNVEYDIAVNHRLRGNFRESLDVIQKVVQQRQDSLGTDHPEYLVAKHQQAVTLFRLSRWREALEEQRATLKTQEYLLGKCHPSTILSRYTLSGILHSLNRLSEADKLLDEVIKDQRMIYNQGNDKEEDHPVVIRSRARHALILLDKGNYKGAEEEQRIVHSRRRTMLGNEHGLTRSAENDLAQILQAAGRFQDAESMYEALRDCLDKKSPLEFQVRSNLASCYYEMKKYEEAASIQKAIYDELKLGRASGAYDERTIASAFNFALTCKAQGKLTQACQLITEAVRKAEDILKSDHPQTIELHATMQAWYKEKDELGSRSATGLSMDLHELE